MFKKITGYDEIEAERKFVQSFLFRPFARLIFSANTPPRCRDADDAFFERWVVIPFTKVFKPGDTGFIPRAELVAEITRPDELSGLLNKALEARARLLSTNRFTESASVRAAGEGFRFVTDPVAVWLSSRLLAGGEMFVPTGEVLSRYNESARASGGVEITANALTRRVKDIWQLGDPKQRTVNGKVTWCYIGVGLRAI